jgi:hypothetical protein
MSIRENLQIFHPLPISKYIDVLQKQYGCEKHPAQAGAYMLDGLPFYAPQEAEDRIFILSFNYAPLASTLIRALLEHPELLPGNAHICWTQEQDLIFEGRLKELQEWDLDTGLPKATQGH